MSNLTKAGVIVMTKDVYKSKMNQLLMGKEKYKIDGTLGNNQLIECSIFLMLQILLFLVTSPKPSTDIPSQIETEIAYMRGLTKIDRPDFPLRPILCLLNAVPQTGSLVSGHFRCHSQSPNAALYKTVELASVLENCLAPHKMLSFRVDSLFTNALLHEAVGFLRDFISSSNRSR